MRLRFWSATTAVTALAMCIPLVRADEPKKQPDKPAAVDPFGSTKVWQFHITVAAKEYEAMQPAGGGFGFGGGFGKPPEKAAEKKPGDRETHRSVFGTEFPIVHASISTEGHTAENVALRYKGNSTYTASARSLKRPMKVDIDQFDENQRFLGLKTLNLHNGVHDPSKSREALAYEIYRAAGVPAPRTAFAEVTLTVPGKYDKELLGLYTVVEQVNKPFLKANYKTDKGLLMKPERIRGLDYLGEDWERYKTTYQPKRDATKEEAARMIAFAKLVNQGTDDQFNKEIATYLDVDAFLRFLAATALVSNLDSFFTLGHNYCLYLHPDTKTFHFIPWDVDLSMGNFAIFGSPEQQMDLSLAKPYGGQSKLADRLLAMKDVSHKYQRVLKELAGTAFAKERVLKELDAIEKTVKPLMERDKKAATDRKEGGMGGMVGFGRPPELKTFVEKRTESVALQIEGKSKGYTPAGGFGGPPGGGFGGPGGFGPGNPLAKPLLDTLDGNKDGKVSEAEFMAGMQKFFGEWDKDKNGTLDQKEIADGLQKLMPPVGKFPGDVPAPRPKGP